MTHSPPPISLLGPVGGVIALIVGSFTVHEEIVAIVVFGIILLLLVELILARRLKSHLLAVNAMLNRMILTADSVDTQHRADTSRMDRIERIAERARKGVEELSARIDKIENQLRR